MPVSAAQEGPQPAFREHRLLEAAAKAKLQAAARRAESERTPNQDDYDVHHYDLDITLNPSIQLLSGTAATSVTVLAGPLTTLDLDLQGDMSVSAATSGGAPATWTHLEDVVTVDLDRAYATGETLTVSLTYSGDPSGGYFGWDSHAGEDMIWTLSEPYGAREWWPCKDLVSDKADSVDVRVTVPEPLTVASNGLLVSEVDNGWTRSFHWRSRYPIVTYLVSLAAYPYYVYSDWYTPLAGGDPMEIRFFVFPDDYDELQENFSLTVLMMEAFAQRFGEYPFVEEKYGHAQFTWGGGIENQTITSLGGWWIDGISHELAHQWWGDSVSFAGFEHIWLAEGFASWCEAWWRELSEGTGTYHFYMDMVAYFGPGTIYVEDPLNEPIFDHQLSYDKASWVVHMLRHVLGDEDFFTGLALYAETHAYGHATTEQFQGVMEQVSGRDLDAFFAQWIYGEYYPHYRFDWTPGPGGDTVELTIEQVQTNTGLFAMPIDLRVTTTSGAQDFVVENSQATEDYTLPVSGEPLSVALDPERWILRRVESEVTNPSFERGILLVNGISWSDYGDEIGAAYADSAFWGEHPISFWDAFPEPDGGYPSTLPAPLGHGPVPGDTLGQFSALIWVGDRSWVDYPYWLETPIASYLETGGNVFLAARNGSVFLGAELEDYLGVTWAETGAVLGNCVAAQPGLVDIPLTGDQSWNDVFLTDVGPHSMLLFKDTVNFSDERGVGAHAQPPGGGTHRPDGARLVHIAGRPYRMGHDALRHNSEFILGELFGEPFGATAAPAVAAARPRLEANHPNPFNPETTIRFWLPESGVIDLAVYDAQGRRLRTLLAGERPAGAGELRWDGRDAAGRLAASGVYLLRLDPAGNQAAARKLIMLK